MTSQFITLMCDTTLFTIDRAMLTAHPNTMLGRMFGTGIQIARANERGYFEVAVGISQSVFRAVMKFYTDGIIYCPGNISIQELHEACDHLLIPFDATTIRCQNLCDLLIELSDKGGKLRFQSLFEIFVLPLMGSCAQKGDRECHIVVLMADDEIFWDEQYPPGEVEERKLRVHNTLACRFLSAIDNHDIANQVMKERGFKKTRVGIEGYPINILKMNLSTTGATRIYHKYSRRPFIQISWEKQVAKKRIVDYEYVPHTSNSRDSY